MPSSLARLPALLLCALTAWAAVPMTKLNVQVTTQGGRPIDRADVVVRFVKGRSVMKLGKQIRTTWEMRTNQEGIAKGYQTFGQTFDVSDAEKTLEIKLNPPQEQYSAH